MSCFTHIPFLSNFASGNAGLEEEEDREERVLDRERDRVEGGHMLLLWLCFCFRDELCDSIVSKEFMKRRMNNYAALLRNKWSAKEIIQSYHRRRIVCR